MINIFDPTEQFVISSITRAEVAQLFNDTLGDDHDIPKFYSGDSRLTSNVCKEVAAEFAELSQEDLDEEEFNVESTATLMSIIVSHFA